MKIIFDRKALEVYTQRNDPHNTPEIVAKRIEKQLKILGKFCKADFVEYIDHGKGESYILKRGKKRIRLSIGGNMYDGGYMSVSKVTEDEQY